MNKLNLAWLSLAAVLTASAQTSAVQWERTFGGTDTDVAQVVKSSADGGYIVGGYSYSGVSGAKTGGSYGAGDYWIVKFDANGNQQWDRSFGGESFDGVNTLLPTADGGWLLGGISFSAPSGNKTAAHHGAGDYWIVKLNSSGGLQWNRSFGGGSNDVLQTVQPTTDGGYILGGTSLSGVSGNKASTAYGAEDYWVVKVDASGNKQWERSDGGGGADELRSVQQTADGGYLLGGHSFSGASGNKSSLNLGAGTSDFWIVKLDASGNRQWERSLGGDDAEELRGAHQTADGGYLLAGHSYSGTTGNKSSPSHGSHDYWLVKLDSGGNKQWDRAYGGADADELHSAHPTTDGGCILGGLSSSGISGSKATMATNTDGRAYWIVKLNGAGDKEWEQSFRGTYRSESLRLEPAAGGGCLVNALGNSLAADTDYVVAKLIEPLRLQSFSVNANLFQARMMGTPGMNYVLQVSTDFINWTSIMTNGAAPSGLVQFNGAATTATAKRFYRARQQ